MAIKKYLLLLMAVLTLPIVLAGNIENNYFYDNTDDSPLDQVYMEIYTCTDTNNQCAAVNPTPWFTANSGAATSILGIEYPGASNPTDYAEFYFRDCYLPLKFVVEDDWGTGGTYDYPTYFPKADNCHAPIEDFSIINTVYANEPVQIDISAALDATTYSAFSFTDFAPQWIPTGALYDDHYSAETLVTLTIYDSADAVVYQTTTNLNLMADTAQDVQFSWTPTVEGDYRADITTDVTDCQCISSMPDSAQLMFTVLSARPQNECYTILNNLATDDQFPVINDVLTVDYTKISNYAAYDYTKTGVPMNVGYEVRLGYNDPSGALVYSYTGMLPATDTYNPTGFNFQFTPVNTGYHTIFVRGQANDVLCYGLTNNPMAVSEVILVEAPVTQCSDEIDNDGDGYIDLADPGCDNSLDDDETNTLAQCQDGIDNDGDGLIDMADPGCTNPLDDDESNNSPPVIISDPVTDADLDETYVYDVEAYDPDGDILTYYLTEFPDGMTIDANSGIITWVPEPDQLRDNEVTVVVSDGVLIDTQSFIIDVDYPDDEIYPRRKIHIHTIRMNGYEYDWIKPGTTLFISTNYENIGYYDIERSSVRATVEELGISTRAGPSSGPDSGDDTTRGLFLDIPEDAAPGVYTIRLTITTDTLLKRARHRDFRII